MSFARTLSRSTIVTWTALNGFLRHDGWAIASHIALSGLMSLFPFLIVVTALAGSLGSDRLADEVAQILLEAWPPEVGTPIANEVRNVLTNSRTDALTLGAFLATYFASSGVEALRVGLNRAYETSDWRPWYVTRLESVIWMLGGALVLLAFAFLVVLGPVIWRQAVSFIPALAPLGWVVTFLRLGAATLVIISGLVLAHLYLPNGRRPFARIWPGVVVTLFLWLLSGVVFGLYLDRFAFAYVSTYAGLATAMISLVFLYTLAAIFLLGAEINGARFQDELLARR